ncbi:hypothetical protein [Jeotgalibaca porci]|uniref:hypothetical protein n=1 Tax=Jeotgalibaca porci TaxID=1868793 RepID=UPI00359F1DFF
MKAIIKSTTGSDYSEDLEKRGVDFEDLGDMAKYFFNRQYLVKDFNVDVLQKIVDINKQCVVQIADGDTLSVEIYDDWRE